MRLTGTANSQALTACGGSTQTQNPPAATMRTVALSRNMVARTFATLASLPAAANTEDIKKPQEKMKEVVAPSLALGLQSLKSWKTSTPRPAGTLKSWMNVVMSGMYCTRALKISPAVGPSMVVM